MACTPGEKKCIGPDLYVCGVSFDTNLMAYVTGWHFSKSNAPECVVEPPPEEEEEEEEPVYVPPIGPPWELPPMPEPTLPSTARFAFMDWIRERLAGVFTFFYSIYAETNGWIWPFHLVSLPFYNLYRSFVYITKYWIDFSDWTAAVWTKVEQTWTSEGIVGLIKWWFPSLANIVEWFAGRWLWFVSVVGDWWDSTKLTVLAWIDEARDWILELLAVTEASLAKLWQDLQWFFDHLLTIDEIIQWWKDWLGRVMAALVRWGFAQMADVTALIISAFLEREDFWSGWQDMRDYVFAFFDDPLEFIWSLFEDWFTGPEE